MRTKLFAILGLAAACLFSGATWSLSGTAKFDGPATPISVTAEASEADAAALSCCVTGDCCCPGQGDCCDLTVRAKNVSAPKPAKRGGGCCVTGNCCCPGQGSCCAAKTEATATKGCCAAKEKKEGCCGK